MIIIKIKMEKKIKKSSLEKCVQCERRFRKIKIMKERKEIRKVKHI